MIVNYRPDNLPTDPGWIREAFPQTLDAVLVDVRWPEGAAEALKIAKARNIPSILDADLPVPRDGELLRLADFIAFSADGLIDYSKQSDLMAALLSVSEETQGLCCVTCGGDGVLLIEDGEIIAIPAFPCDPVDTLGAGDIWHGAFALLIAEGEHAKAAINVANACAAIKVSRRGGRKGRADTQ